MTPRRCEECGSRIRERAACKDPYHYTLSGLPNVYLCGIKLQFCPQCKTKDPVIPRITELHRVIAEFVAQSTELLTGNEIRFLRKWAGFEARRLAALLGVTPFHLSSSRVENGKEPMGPPTERLARLIALAVINDEVDRDMLVRLADSLIHAKRRQTKTNKPIFRFVRKRWRAPA